jgi:hypothetical protein
MISRNQKILSQAQQNKVRRPWGMGLSLTHHGQWLNICGKDLVARPEQDTMSPQRRNM